MNVGMLWLDSDTKRPFDEKVQRAIDYYRQKYGRLPEVCMVNPNMVSEEKKVGRVEVQHLKTVLPHHFWLGMKPS